MFPTCSMRDENSPANHNNVQKMHCDHTYAMEQPSVLNPSTQPADLSEPVPSTANSSPGEQAVMSLQNNEQAAVSVLAAKKWGIPSVGAKVSPTYKNVSLEYKMYKKQTNVLSKAKKAFKFNKELALEKLLKNMSILRKMVFWIELKLNKKKLNPRTLTLEEKIIAQSIIRESRVCYKFLLKLFVLPRRTLRLLVARMNAEPNVDL